MAKDHIPKNQRVLLLVEVKSYWIGVFEEIYNREGGRRIDEC
jgi:hypothetical protein